MATSACCSSASARICSTLPAPTKVAGWTRRSACTICPATTSPAVSARRASSASDSLAGRSMRGRSVPTRIARSCLAAVVCARSLKGRTSPRLRGCGGHYETSLRVPSPALPSSAASTRTVARGRGGRNRKAHPAASRARRRRDAPTRHLGDGGEQLVGVERLRKVHVVAAVPEELLSLRVDERDPPLTIDPDDSIGSGIEQVAEPAVGGCGRGARPERPDLATTDGGGGIGDLARAGSRGL